MQRCAQYFWIVSEVELDPTSETVALNVSLNIGMGGHTLKHCVARDVSANVSGNVALCVWAFTVTLLSSYHYLTVAIILPTACKPLP